MAEIKFEYQSVKDYLPKSDNKFYDVMVILYNTSVEGRISKMTKLKPYLVCKECRHEEGWNDREMGSRWYFCGKYHKLVGECKKDCLKLRKGLVRQIQENCSQSKELENV